MLADHRNRFRNPSTTEMFPPAKFPAKRVSQLWTFVSIKLPALFFAQIGARALSPLWKIQLSGSPDDFKPLRPCPQAELHASQKNAKKPEITRS